VKERCFQNTGPPSKGQGLEEQGTRREKGSREQNRAISEKSGATRQKQGPVGSGPHYVWEVLEKESLGYIEKHCTRGEVGPKGVGRQERNGEEAKK